MSRPGRPGRAAAWAQGTTLGPHLRARSLFALAVIGLLCMVGPGPVAGHAELVAASPGPDETVAGSVAALRATFSQDLDASRSSIEIRDGAGAVVARGGKDPREARAMHVELRPPLGPGEYDVRWTSYSAEDDELARGTYEFSVVAAAATPSPPPTGPATGTLGPVAASVSPSPTPREGASPDADATPLLLLLVVAVAGAGLIAGTALLRTRRR
jgi:methionine-rich copper-binding protein CopC